MASQLVLELPRVEPGPLLLRQIADPALVPFWGRLARHLEEPFSLPQAAPTRDSLGDEPAQGLDPEPPDRRRDPLVPVGELGSGIALVSGQALVSPVAVERHR